MHVKIRSWERDDNMRSAICDDNKLRTSDIEEYIASLPFKDITYDILKGMEGKLE